MEITPRSKREISRILNRIYDEDGERLHLKTSISKVQSAFVDSEARNTIYVNCDSNTTTTLARIIQACDGTDDTLALNGVAGRFSLESELFIKSVSKLRPELKKNDLQIGAYIRRFEIYRLGILLIAIAANTIEDSSMPTVAAANGDSQQDTEEQRAAEIYNNSPTLQEFDGDNNSYEGMVFRFLVKTRNRVAKEDRSARSLINAGKSAAKNAAAEYPFVLLVKALECGEKITSSFADRLVRKWAGPVDYYLARQDKLQLHVESLIERDSISINDVDLSLFDDPRDSRISLSPKAAVRVVKMAKWLKRHKVAGGGSGVRAQPLSPVTAAQTIGITGQWAKPGLAVQGAAVFHGLPL